jgi:hypothetical protein
MILESYRIAGELYGRLKQELGFGELVMLSHNSSIMFQWDFSAKGKRYRCQEAVSLMSLHHMDIETLTTQISSGWKREHRNATTHDEMD